jgi:phosphomannomutase
MPPLSEQPVAALDAIVKRYDIRGRVPSELDEDVARRLGIAIAAVLCHADGLDAIAVGRDMRTSSPRLTDALCDGLTSAGVDVVDLGVVATDVLYFASGRLGLPGVMVTASHNPAEWNGFKLCRPGARPVGRDSGLDEIRDRAGRQGTGRGTGEGAVLDGRASGPGRRTSRDVLDEFADHVVRLGPTPRRRLRVVVDAANAMAATTAPAVLGRLDVDLVPLHFDLDGRFPHHPADPMNPDNLADLRRAVVASGADVGLAFDGDADRCFAVDETGAAVPASTVVALVARQLLRRHPGATVLYSLTCSRVVPEEIAAAGGVGVRTRVGHSGIKAAMAEHGAVFGGEHSGHYYFRDFWYADSGMLAAVHLLAEVASSDRPLSDVVAALARYVGSEEISVAVADPVAAVETVRRVFESEAGAALDQLDGLTVSERDWWFNVRTSNTEPLVRLNVEAADRAMMERVRDRVLAVIRSHR